MFWKNKKQQTNAEIITDEEELQLILEMKHTKEKYESLLSDLKNEKRELDDALRQVRLLLKDMKQEYES